MTMQTKISNLLLAAALSAASTSYAANDTDTKSAEMNAANQSVVNDVRPSVKVISQEPIIFKKGFFTDTQISSRVIEVEETEYFGSKEPLKISQSEQTPSGISLVKAYDGAKAIAKPVINTYQEVETCEENIFYGRCESTRTKIEGLSRSPN